MESVHQRLAHHRVGAGRHQCGRFALRHFSGKTRPAQNAAQGVGCYLALHFMAQHSPILPIARGFKAFAQPDCGHCRVCQGLQHGAQRGHGGGDHDQTPWRAVLEHRLQDTTGNGKSFRQDKAGKVSGIGAPGLQTLGQHRVAGPERDSVPPQARGGGRQCRAPSPRTQHQNLHGDGPPRVGGRGLLGQACAIALRHGLVLLLLVHGLEIDL